MRPNGTITAVDLLSTCPSRKQSSDSRSYLQEVVNVAQWSEQAGFKGILIYTANVAQADPWLLAQVIIQNTQHLCPLVAVQPVYMHPYTVAKLIASLGNLYGRRVDLNMVAGGFKYDLFSLGDQTAHDERYERLIEYTSMIRLLLESSAAINYTGTYYILDHVKLEPQLPRGLFPKIFVSGSSSSAINAARKVNATSLHYPVRIEQEMPHAPSEHIDSGIRVGIIAREDEAEAWKIAHERFREDRKGQVTQLLAASVSDSVWHKQLSEMSEEAGAKQGAYWLGPFQNYKEYCPYLVGSYDQVGAELAAHIGLGRRSFILDVPYDPDELIHTKRAFNVALKTIDLGAV
jgi:alkanesulfonate monooxygenase